MGTPVARLAVLRAAIARDADPSNRLAHAATLDLLDRAEPGAGDRSLPGLGAASPRPRPSSSARRLADDGRRAGQHGLGRRLRASPRTSRPSTGWRSATATSRSRPSRPRSTSCCGLVRRCRWPLGSPGRSRAPADRRRAWSPAGSTRRRRAQIARRCSRSGYWLVTADVDPDAPGPELTTVEDVLSCADHGGITAWRSQVAIVAANPWAPYPAELHQLLVDGGRPSWPTSSRGVIKYYRTPSEQHDRQLVAREIRRLVAVSGLSQRQFAALCGTSAPRISTYVNGLVTPSAAMMVRFTRVSERAQRQDRAVREAPPPRRC